MAGAGLGPVLVRSVAGSSAVQIAGMAVTFLVGVQLARGLGVAGYGIYGIAMAVISLASIPGEFGLPKLVTREVAAASARDDLPTLFGVLRWSDKACYLISALVAGVTALGAFLFVGESTSPMAEAILWGAPVIPLLALAKIRGAALQGLHFIVRGQVAVAFARPLLLSVLLFLLFWFVSDAGPAEVMALNSLTAAAALILSHWWLKSRLPRPAPARIAQHGKKWRASSVPMALGEGVMVINVQLGILLLGLLAGSTEVGLFRIAISILAVVGLPILLVNAVVSPVMARLFAEEDRRRLQQLCSSSAQAMAAAILGMTVLLAVWGADLLALLFGEEFVPALPALLLMCGGVIFSAAFGPNATLLNMTGHERRVTRAMSIGLAVNLALVLALVPEWGTLGAAIGMVGSLLVWNLLAWNDARRLLGINTSLIPTPIANADRSSQ